MDTATSEFLTAFNAIDDWFRRRLNAPPGDEFHELVGRLAGSHTVVRSHAHELRRFARLRNLLVHAYSTTSPIAIPAAHAVQKISQIRDVLVSPPLLLPLAAKPVNRCSPGDPVGQAAKQMHDGSFSQLPVYDGALFIGLLTAETVARWLASKLAGGLAMVEEEPVSEVFKHIENGNNYAFMGRNSTVVDGITAFDASLQQGVRLEAILITHSGKSTEQPLGILTVYDIPVLRHAILE